MVDIIQTFFLISSIVSPKDYKLHKIESGPSLNVTITRDEFLSLYREMKTIRDMENEARKLYLAKEIKGFCHLYIGQVQ